MRPTLLAATALLAILSPLRPAAADAYDAPARPRLEGARPHHASAPRRAWHRHGRLPPEVRYRDPRVGSLPRAAFGPPAAPDFLFDAYLPRFTEAPIYNEPFPRYPYRR